MSMLIECTCGQTLSVRDEYLGKRIKCPACGARTLVAVPGQSLPPRPASASPPTPHPGSQEEVEEEQEEGEERERRPRTKRRKKQKDNADGGGFWGFEKRILNGGVICGVLGMVGAVVWFVLGLMADRIFFYPPILFVVGVIALIKGIVSAGGSSND